MQWLHSDKIFVLTFFGEVNKSSTYFVTSTVKVKNLNVLWFIKSFDDDDEEEEKDKEEKEKE